MAPPGGGGEEIDIFAFYSQKYDLTYFVSFSYEKKGGGGGGSGRMGEGYSALLLISIVR